MNITLELQHLEQVIEEIAEQFFSQAPYKTAMELKAEIKSKILARKKEGLFIGHEALIPLDIAQEPAPAGNNDIGAAQGVQNTEMNDTAAINNLVEPVEGTIQPLPVEAPIASEASPEAQKDTPIVEQV